MSKKTAVPNRTCHHPFMVQHVGQDPIPPVKMTGRCSHNYGCPVCGFGVGQYPDPCDQHR